MFEHLSDYSVILVTGPQRSGTQIAARMIAEDTPLWYLDEQAFRAVDVDAWYDIVAEAGMQVIQCPGMCRFVHEFGDRDDLAVVLMRRSVEDIIASQQRIGWRYEQLELARYGEIEGPIAEVKYWYWDKHQKDKIQHAYEIDYECISLRNNGLYRGRR
jgi:hypothetical protein